MPFNASIPLEITQTKRLYHLFQIKKMLVNLVRGIEIIALKVLVITGFIPGQNQKLSIFYSYLLAFRGYAQKISTKQKPNLA